MERNIEQLKNMSLDNILREGYTVSEYSNHDYNYRQQQLGTRTDTAIGTAGGILLAMGVLVVVAVVTMGGKVRSRQRRRR